MNFRPNIERPTSVDGGSLGTRLHENAVRLKEVRRQPIVDRHERIVGYEKLARLSIDTRAGTVEDSIGRLSKGELGRLTRELLMGLRIRCLLNRNYETQADVKKFAHTSVLYFVNVEKLSLTEPALVRELIEADVDLRSSGGYLVVEVTERPVATVDQFRSYMKGLMCLKQAKVLVALDDYNIDSPVHWELDLGLCDVVKLDLPSLGICECGDEGLLAARHSALVAKLNAFVYRYRVDLLAEKVETDWQYEFVKKLPFNLFQGYRFGRPEPV